VEGQNEGDNETAHKETIKIHQKERARILEVL